MRDVQIAIDYRTIVRNIKSLRAKLAPGVMFCAVIKSNAYGIGDVEVAKTIAPYVDMFAVARMSESIRLRETGDITRPILLLGPCEDFALAIKHSIAVTITSMEEMHSAARASLGGKISIHIEINTGMNRFGINNLWHLRSMIRIASRHPNIEVAGLCTHMSSAREIDAQLRRFAPYRAMIKRFYPRAIIHAACSEGIHHRGAHFDMVRIGKAMYGGIAGYKTALTLRARVVAIQQIAKGASIGYKSLFTANQTMTIGIVNCGYAVAGFLTLGVPTHVYIDKTPCKVLGSICMDTIFIDITHAPDSLGKSVTIISPTQNTLSQLADKSGHSAAKILCL